MENAKILCIGDSLTFGYEIESSNKWTTLLAQQLKLEIINCGVNGDTTAGMLARFESCLGDYNPTHIIIMGGTNDLWFGLKDELIISNIHAMARLAKHNGSEAIIGIPTPYFNLNELNFVQENFSECIRSFKRTLMDYCLLKEISFIDFSLNLTASHVLDDGLHLNEQGQNIMMKNALNKLKVILN